MIPHSQPTLTAQDKHALRFVSYLSQGPAVAKFERQFARYHGKTQAVAVSSGTSALHLALLALGVKKNQEVLLPTYVCTALLNAIHYVGATPVLVDVDPETGNMSWADAKGKRTRRSKCLILPHMFGQPADVSAFKKLGLPIIEDCAQAIGAKYKGRRVGTQGDLGIFSFYATKMMATGEGGMVLARSAALLNKVRDQREYDHCSDYKLRFNYKMTDIQASLGSSQLKQLNAFIRKRKSIATIYQNALADLPVEIPDAASVYYRFIFKSSKRNQIRQALRRKKIMAEPPVYKPIHLYLKKRGFKAADDWYKRGLSIPIYPQLSLKEAKRIGNLICQTF